MVMRCGLKAFSLLAVALAGIVPGFAGSLPSTYLVPPGLNYGDQYRLMFVTSTTRDANSSNIGDYDSFVTSVANAGGSVVQELGVQWKAIGSTADYWDITTYSINHIATTPNVPIYGLDGIQIATGAGNGSQELFSGSLMSGIHISEQATDLTGSRVFTGTTVAGLANHYPPSYGYWYTLGFFQDYTMTGLSGSTDSTWVEAGAVWRNGTAAQYSLYAISPVLTNDAPEAGTISMVMIGGVLLGLARRRLPRRST